MSNRQGRVLSGRDSQIITASFRAATPVTSSSRWAYRALVRARSSVAATSWAVTAEPSENRASALMRIVQTRRWLSYSQLSASTGWGWNC